MYRVSVVIPTLNRADMLATTIDRIEHQTVGRDSLRSSRRRQQLVGQHSAVLAQKAATYPNLRGFIQLKPGAAATRNVGIREASGDIVLFIDDDILAEPDLVERHLKYHAQNAERLDHRNRGVALGEFHRSVPSIPARQGNLQSVQHRVRQADGFFLLPHGKCLDEPEAACAKSAGSTKSSLSTAWKTSSWATGWSKQGCRMMPGPAAKARHEYFPTYEQFSRAMPAGRLLPRKADRAASGTAKKIYRKR